MHTVFTLSWCPIWLDPLDTVESSEKKALIESRPGQIGLWTHLWGQASGLGCVRKLAEPTPEGGNMQPSRWYQVPELLP